MSAVVKLGNANRTGSYLGIPSDAQQHVIVTKALMGVMFRAGQVEVVGGKNDGTILEDKIVEANQHVVIRLPISVKPYRYHIAVSYNPELLLSGIVSCPSIVAPEQGGDSIYLAFKATKKTDLNQFNYIFHINMID